MLGGWLQCLVVVHTRAVLWDVDGTLVDSTALGLTATNKVLSEQNFDAVTQDEYYRGCRFSTPDRFNFHLKQPPGSKLGIALGDLFDRTYVSQVSKKTAGLFDGMEQLLRSLAMAGHPQGVLSNACGEYVRAVVRANELDSVDGIRVGIFGAALGADEVASPKPSGAGLLSMCDLLGVDPSLSVYVGDSPTDGGAARAAGMKSIGVTWGANCRSSLEGHFDTVVEDISGLASALYDCVGCSE